MALASWKSRGVLALDAAGLGSSLIINSLNLQALLLSCCAASFPSSENLSFIKIRGNKENHVEKSKAIATTVDNSWIYNDVNKEMIRTLTPLRNPNSIHYSESGKITSAMTPSPIISALVGTTSFKC